MRNRWYGFQCLNLLLVADSSPSLGFLIHRYLSGRRKLAKLSPHFQQEKLTLGLWFRVSATFSTSWEHCIQEITQVVTFNIVAFATLRCHTFYSGWNRTMTVSSAHVLYL